MQAPGGGGGAGGWTQGKPADWDSAFLRGPTFRPKVPPPVRQEPRTGLAPAQRPDLASASHLGLATSLGNKAGTGLTRLSLPSLQLCGREGASPGRGDQLRAHVHVDTCPLCRATRPRACTCRPAVASPWPACAHRLTHMCAQCLGVGASLPLWTRWPARQVLETKVGRVVGTQVGRPAADARLPTWCSSGRACKPSVGT